MTATKRSKNSRQRASTTHGWGSMKKHRGAGNRGGRGNSGTGKRAAQKKTLVWKNPNYFGKYGFKKKNIKVLISHINLKTIEDSLTTWVTDKKVIEENGVFVVDLEKIGYNKLLSAGKVQNKMKIIVPSASKKAVEKVQGAGGSVEGIPAES